MQETTGKEETPISDINFLVERLEKLLGEAWRIPMSAYVIVSDDEFLNLIDQIRTAVPKEVKQAERILQERERTLSQAEEEAERIIQQAREEAEKLAEDHAIINTANQRAQTIVERAQRDAETLKAEADEYARVVLLDLDSQLGTLDNQIAKVISTVRNGMEKLTQARQQRVEEQL